MGNKELLELLNKSNLANTAYKNNLMYGHELDKLDSKILNDDNKKENLKKLSSLENEVDLMFENNRCFLTAEEYDNKIKDLTTTYLKNIKLNKKRQLDTVVVIKTFDKKSTEKLAILSNNNDGIKEIVQAYSEKSDSLSFSHEAVFIMPLTSLNFFSDRISDLGQEFKSSNNKFFFMNHLNQEISKKDIKDVLNAKYNNNKVENLFRAELGLGITHIYDKKGESKINEVDVICTYLKNALSRENNIRAKFGFKFDPKGKGSCMSLITYKNKKPVTILSELAQNKKIMAQFNKLKH